MNPEDFSPRMRELIAKDILLSKGGTIYPMNKDLVFDIKDLEGNVHPTPVTSVHYAPGVRTPGYYYVYLDGSCFILTDCEDFQKLWDYVIRNYMFPDKDITFNEDIIADRVLLREKNICYINERCDLNYDDFEMIERYRDWFHNARKTTYPIPLPGDIVEGSYYNGMMPFDNGLIESRPHYEEGKLSLCAVPFTPFVFFHGYKEGDTRKKNIALNVSGGPFFGINASDLQYVGEGERWLCDWGHTGVGASGTVRFNVKVNKWRLRKGAI